MNTEMDWTFKTYLGGITNFHASNPSPIVLNNKRAPMLAELYL